MRHWFDGYAQLMRIEFNRSGFVTVTMKMQNTTDFATMESTKAFDYVGFSTPKFPGKVNFSAKMKPSPIREATPIDARLAAFEKEKLEGIPRMGSKGFYMINNDVSIAQIEGRLFTTTDNPIYVEFSPKTLDVNPNSAMGCPYTDKLIGFLGAAHGAVDTRTNEYFGILGNIWPLFLGGKVQNQIWSTNVKDMGEKFTGITRELRGVVETKDMVYYHSIGLSQQYVAYLELPLVENILGFPLAIPVGELLYEVPNVTSITLHLISRADGTTTQFTVPLDPGRHRCMLHTGNVFEDDDGMLNYDGVFYDTCDIYTAFEIGTLLTYINALVSHGRLMRIKVDPRFPNASGEFTFLSGEDAAFPWYNKNFHMRPYRYAYSTSLFHMPAATGHVSKFDVVKNITAATYTKPNLVLSEFIYVPTEFNPDQRDEDEDLGALMAIAFDTVANTSQLVALNATDLTEMFVVDLPFVIPLHFHGIYCTKGNKDCVWN